MSSKVEFFNRIKETNHNNFFKRIKTSVRHKSGIFEISCIRTNPIIRKTKDCYPDFWIVKNITSHVNEEPVFTGSFDEKSLGSLKDPALIQNIKNLAQKISF